MKLLLMVVSIVFLSTAANAGQCPEPAGFESWRNQMVDSLSAHASSGEGLTPVAVEEKILDCFSSEVPACFNTVLEYSRTMKTGAPEVPDFLTWPEEFREKSLFGGYTGDFVIPENLEELAQQNGWDFIRFKTRSSGGFSDRPGLTIIHIPGEEISRYLQFSTAPDDNDTNYHEPLPLGSISGHDSQKPASIVVKKGKDGERSQLYFQRWMETGPYQGFKETDTYEYLREYATFNKAMASIFSLTGEQTYQLEVKDPTKEMGQPTKTCISCHASGLRAISPVGYHPDRHGWERHPDREAIKRLNETMSSYGQVEFPVAGGEAVRLDYAGPPMGSKAPYHVNPDATSSRDRLPTRTTEFLKACAEGGPRTISFSNNGPSETYTMSEEPKIRYGKLRRAMRCTKCHNGGVDEDDRGIIISQGATNHPKLGFFGEDLRYKILFDQSMPPKEKLNMDERVALVKCLEAEAKFELTAWLKRDACDGSTTVPNHHGVATSSAY